MKKLNVILSSTVVGMIIFMSLWIIKSPNRETAFENILSSLNSINITEREKVLVHELLALASNIHQAKIHVRGVKTGKALFKASRNIAKILQMYKIDIKNVTNRKVKKATSVCPEVYLGNSIGYPFFYRGYETANCTTVSNLSKVITVGLVFSGNNITELQELLLKVKEAHVNTVIGLQNISEKEVQNFFLYFKNVQFVYSTSSVGSVWNHVVSKVNTKYVIIGRDVIWFNQDVRLERLVRQIERTGATTAGGSYRNGTGHWFIGCQQRVYRNFTLVYEAGYFESFEACQFCDHVDGPFVIRTELAKSHGFNTHIKQAGLFEDFFFRLRGKEHLVCPDALFFTNISERSLLSKDWQSFAFINGVQKLIFSGKEIIIPCPKTYPCAPTKNSALSPCCQKELADLLVTFMDTCKEENILCELDSGSVLGAVKFQSILPWEKDADTVFLSDNYTFILGLKDKFKKKGYTLETVNDSWNWRPAINGSERSTKGFFYLRSKNWYIEMWGMSFLGSEDEVHIGQPKSKINVNGNWVNSIRNPAVYARNRYGGDIFQHAQHWSETGHTSSWTAYKTNQFLKCGSPDHPSCLDQFNADGNIQFHDPIP